MSHAEEARISALDQALDQAARTDQTAAQLFAVVDVLDGQVGLRRALTDPSTPVSGRRLLVSSLFGGKVGEEVVAVLAEAAAQRWSSGRHLTAAVERQAVRAEFATASQLNQLDETEDELFRFNRLVQANPALREAVADRSRSVGARQELVTSLLQGKATPVTINLVRRAVAAREHTFAATVESYLALAAAIRNRSIAVVRTARPLPAEQRERLRSVLTRQVGREVDLQVIVDPQVLGGIRVELGDEVIEGTIVGRLEEARRHFR